MQCRVPSLAMCCTHASNGKRKTCCMRCTGRAPHIHTACTRPVPADSKHTHHMGNAKPVPHALHTSTQHLCAALPVPLHSKHTHGIGNARPVPHALHTSTQQSQGPATQSCTILHTVQAVIGQLPASQKQARLHLHLSIQCTCT